MDEVLKNEQQRVDEVTQKMAYEEQIANENYDQAVIHARNELLKSANVKIKDGNEDAMRESSFRIKQHEDQLLIEEHKIEQLERQKQLLAQMKENPYFGRIDFTDDEGEVTTLYLGIGSFSEEGVHYVYDWRAPVANLFYTDGLGEQQYEVDGTTQTAQLLLKRQFIIKHRQIQVMEDTNETIGDDVLLEVLSDESTSHMKNIVGTIQAEQNQWIRDTKHPYLLIEGVAGSGKTSVLMQRIAYLLYQDRNQLSADDLLMLSPNPIFSEYISQVLPSLGEENIYRTEFMALLAEMSTDTLIECPPAFKDLQEWLSSMAGVKAFEHYFEQLQLKGLQFKEIWRDDEERLFSRKQLAQLFHQTNDQNAVWQRLEVLQQYLIKQIQHQTLLYAQSEEMERRLDVEGGELYDEIMEKDPTLSFDEAKEQLSIALAEITFEKPFVQVKRMQWINYRMQYIHFLTSLNDQLPADLQPLIADYIQWVKAEMKAHKMTAVDSQYYLMLRKILASQTVRHLYQWIFIDEIQDYTPLNLKYLATVFPTAKYTMAGDANQLIFHNQHALSSMEDIFHHEVERGTLLTSYRSTAEITALSAAVLGQDNIAKVARHGHKPEVVIGQHNEALMKWLQNGQGRTAIITRTMAEAEAFYAKYHALLPELVKLEPGHLASHQSLFVLPLTLAKGLEFDRVVVWQVDQYTVTERSDQIDLYTAMTRAMHELVLTADNLTDWLIDLHKQPLLTFSSDSEAESMLK